MNYILVVDDEWPIVNLITLNLELSGYSCDFYVGKEAAKEITNQGITLEEYLGQS